jgi:simple sugar transport system permease protein
MIRISKQELSVLLTCIALAFGFQIASHGQFFDIANLQSIAALAAEVGIVALGATMLIIGGEFDLSVGSTFALAGMTFSMLTTKGGVSAPVAMLAVFAIAIGVGFINGWITVKAKVPSFITTLGALMIVRGLVLAITGGWPVAWTDDPSAFMRWMSGDASTLWWIALAIATHLILLWTPFGNWLFAVGGNAGAARAVGIRVDRVKMSAFVLSSLFASIAGVMQFSRMSSFSPTYGEGLELEAITATVIGGTLLAGGRGAILGTVLGTILISMLSSGLIMSGVPVYWYRIFVGIILIGAVVMNKRMAP